MPPWILGLRDLTDVLALLWILQTIMEALLAFEDSRGCPTVFHGHQPGARGTEDRTASPIMSFPPPPDMIGDLQLFPLES